MSASVEDRIQTELWRGAIPVEIHLAADEVADVAPPPPFFGLIPRGAYLPVWYDRETEPSPRQHFEPFVARFPDNVLTNQRNADAVGDEGAPSPDVAEPDTPSARADEKKKSRNRVGSTTTARRCAGTCAPGPCTTSSLGGKRTAPSRLARGDSPCTTRLTERTKTTPLAAGQEPGTPTFFRTRTVCSRRETNPPPARISSTRSRRRCTSSAGAPRWS